MIDDASLLLKVTLTGFVGGCVHDGLYVFVTCSSKPLALGISLHRANYADYSSSYVQGQGFAPPRTRVQGIHVFFFGLGHTRKDSYGDNHDVNLARQTVGVLVQSSLKIISLSVLKQLPLVVTLHINSFGFPHSVVMTRREAPDISADTATKDCR